MTGQIITNGVQTFEPVTENLGNIASEFIPYMIFIAIGCLTRSLATNAVKMILRYLNKKGNIFNREVKYDRKRHNRDEKAGKLRPEREYYK